MDTVKYTKSLNVGEWFFTYIISLVPLLGIIMLFVWAFGNDTQPNKRNWAKAMLVMYVIVVAIVIVMVVLMGAVLGGLFMEIFNAANSSNGL